MSGSVVASGSLSRGEGSGIQPASTTTVTGKMNDDVNGKVNGSGGGGRRSTAGQPGRAEERALRDDPAVRW